MCCILYYIYRKCRNYFKKPSKVEDENLAETLYNAKQLEKYVRTKKKRIGCIIRNKPQFGALVV